MFKTVLKALSMNIMTIKIGSWTVREESLFFDNNYAARQLFRVSSYDECGLEEDGDENTKITKQNSTAVRGNWLNNLKYRRLRSARTKKVLVFNCSQSVPLQGCCF
jgi:hypothetical protein